MTISFYSGTNTRGEGTMYAYDDKGKALPPLGKKELVKELNEERRTLRGTSNTMEEALGDYFKTKYKFKGSDNKWLIDAGSTPIEIVQGIELSGHLKQGMGTGEAVETLIKDNFGVSVAELKNFRAGEEISLDSILEPLPPPPPPAPPPAPEKGWFGKAKDWIKGFLEKSGTAQIGVF